MAEMVDFGFTLDSYELKDYGAYKCIQVSYSDNNRAQTHYRINRGDEMISYNNVIPLTCVSRTVEFYGYKRGKAATASVFVELSPEKMTEVKYFPVYTGTIAVETLTKDRFYSEFYFKDVTKANNVETAFPRHIRSDKLDISMWIAVKREDENRLDFIAEEYLGNGRLWWIIADYNNLVKPLIEVKEGTSLAIPSIGDLYADGGALRNPALTLYQHYAG